MKLIDCAGMLIVVGAMLVLAGTFASPSMMPGVMGAALACGVAGSVLVAIHKRTRRAIS